MARRGGRGRRRLRAHEAASLLVLGAACGFLAVVLAAGTVRSAYAEDSDLFGFLRHTFGVPTRATVAAAVEPRRGWRRWAAGRRQARRVTLSQIRDERRRAAARRPRAAALPALVTARTLTPPPTPTSPPRAPNLTGAVDPRVVREEGAAYRRAAAGRGAPGAADRTTLCVRLCDGYAFPVGRLGAARDLPLHRTACETGCPGAQTALFTLAPGAEDVTQARSLAGRDYGSLRTALAFRQRLVPACSCHDPGQVASPRLPLARDGTLRPGDIVAGGRTGHVVQAGTALRAVSLRQDRTLGPAERRQVARRFGWVDPPVRVRLSAADPPPEAPPAGVRVVVPAPY